MSVTIYHNPDCGTSRNVLAMIRQSGVEPRSSNISKTPPSREKLLRADQGDGHSACVISLREKGTPYHELGLDNPDLTDEQLIDQMLAHPILINRPIVVTDKGREALPPLRDRASLAAKSAYRTVRQGRRRGGRGRALKD